MLGHLFDHVPDWAEELGRLGYARMLRCLEAELSTRGLSFRRRETTLLVEPGRAVIRLRALATTLLALPKSQWPEAVAKHVGVAVDESNWAREISLEAQRLMDVQDRLRVIMVPELSGSIGRTVVVGAHACVAVETARRPWIVTDDVAEAWRKQGNRDDDLFALALAQTPRLDEAVRTAVVSVPDPEEGHAGCLRHERFELPWFAASSMARLAELELGPRGLLVSVPSPHCALLRRLDEAADIASLASMVEVTHELHATSQPPLSTSLFWYYRGSVRPLAVSLGPTGVHLYPDEELERAVLFRRHESPYRE